MPYVNKELERRTTNARCRLNYKITMEDPVLKAAHLEKERLRKQRRTKLKQDKRILEAARRMHNSVWEAEDSMPFELLKDIYIAYATVALYPERVLA